MDDRIRNSALAQQFIRGRHIDVTHFYSIGDRGSEEVEYFAIGYFTTDSVFIHGVWEFNGEDFTQVEPKQTDLSWLSEALNSGDGTYKP